MILHKLFDPCRKLLPGFISRPARAVVTAFATPLFFAQRTGHFKSSLRMKAVSRSGHPIPWYTYSAFDFLRDKVFTECDVLEFGSGQSTMWWGARAKHVISFEANREWFEYVRNHMPANVAVHHLPRELDGMEAIVPEDMTFDAVVVDGLARTKACKLLYRQVRPGGFLLLDNANGYPEVMEHFRNEGWSRIDFYGHAPGVIMPHCTSIFFKDRCFLLEGACDPFYSPLAARGPKQEIEA